MPFHLTYDATVDVAYLVLRPTGPGDILGPTLLLENDRAFAGAVSADFTLADARLVGLEFQMASTCLPPDLLLSAERMDGQNVLRRLDERWERRIAMGRRPGRGPERVQ